MLMVLTQKTNMGIQASAFHALFPSWRVLRHGGEFPWEEDKEKTCVACPDPFNPVVIELRRIKK